MRTADVVDSKDATEPLIRGKKVTATNEATMRTVIDAGEFGTLTTDEPVPHGGTGEGPSPLQTVIGALCGCEAVTFNRTAAEMSFAYEGIEFEAAFTIDIRGRLGNREVRPHFQTVKLEATVFTSASEEELAAVVEESEARCPVLNLIQDAGVDVTIRWVRQGI